MYWDAFANGFGCGTAFVLLLAALACWFYDWTGRR